jgi:hypothetical protein
MIAQHAVLLVENCMPSFEINSKLLQSAEIA